MSSSHFARKPVSANTDVGDSRDIPHNRLKIRHDLLGVTPDSRGFAAVLAAFRTTGGTVRGDDLGRLMEDHRLGDFLSLARLIVSRQVFAFEWRDTFWIPMFQFDQRDLSVKKGSRQVLAELASVFDGWTLAAWFAQPNSWLKDRLPVDLLDSHPGSVLAAARVDRFIATG